MARDDAPGRPLPPGAAPPDEPRLPARGLLAISVLFLAVGLIINRIPSAADEAFAIERFTLELRPGAFDLGRVTLPQTGRYHLTLRLPDTRPVPLGPAIAMRWSVRGAGPERGGRMPERLAITAHGLPARRVIGWFQGTAGETVQIAVHVDRLAAGFAGRAAEIELVDPAYNARVGRHRRVERTLRKAGLWLFVAGGLSFGAWAVLVQLRAAVRRHRRRHGRCVECGHRLVQQTICPECGAVGS